MRAATSRKDAICAHPLRRVGAGNAVSPSPIAGRPGGRGMGKPGFPLPSSPGAPEEGAWGNPVSPMFRSAELQP